MPEKNLFPTVSINDVGSEFDDLFKDPEIEEVKRPDTDSETTAATPTSTRQSSAAAEDGTPLPSKEKPKKVRVPRKKKGATSKSGSNVSTAASGSELPMPPCELTKQQIDWFFSNPAVFTDPKVLRVDDSTKEALYLVAWSAGVPMTSLADNIIRWFLLANKAELTKIIARNRDPFSRLDS